MSKPVKKTDQEKAWNRQKPRKYTPVYQVTTRSFLIICEGANTEPNYFKSFPQTTATVTSYGIGASKTALVRHAMEAQKQADKSEEIWVVFDMDAKADQLSQQKEDYNRAIELATKHGIKAAVSNDAFELWFVLHFQEVTAAMHRNQYYQILSEKLEINYEKAGKAASFSRKLYERLHEHPDASLPDALRRAKRLHEAHIAEGLAPADQNPCTTVYALVCALLEGETDCPAVCAEA